MTEVDVLENQPCPMCHKETLTLREMERDIPYFGHTFIFSMDCSNCDYHMADVEAEEEKGPVKFTIDVESEDDLNIRVIKGSQATIKIPRMVEITPTAVSNGYITNVEGILNRIKKVIEDQRDSDDNKVRKKAKNHLKKLQRVIWGRDKIKIKIEDPTGNSAVITDKKG